MTIFLGLLTAFAVVGWGVRWYMVQDGTTLQSHLQRLLARIRQAAPLPIPESPPLLPHEAAEQLMQSQASTESTESIPRAEAVKQQEAEPAEEEEGKVMGYCPRCLARREVAEPSHTTTRKGQPAIRGHCAVCDVGMLVFIAGEGEGDEFSDEEGEAEATEAPASPDAAES